MCSSVNKKEDSLELEKNSRVSVSHSDWHYEEDEDETRICNETKMGTKIEIKDEHRFQEETTEVKHKPELAFEFVPVLPVNKKESILETTDNEDLLSSKTTRLSVKAINQDDSDTCTSISQINLENRCHQMEEVTSSFETTGMYTVLEKNVKKNIYSFNYNSTYEGDQHSKNVSTEELVECKLTYDRKQLHSCNVCGKTFSQKYALNKHMFVHSGTKRYQCDNCEKRFTWKNELKRHMLCHSGTRPYKCDRCEKCFTWKSHLERHMLSHTGTKPFSCDSCEKRFIDKLGLQRHILSHSGTKPYKCDNCERFFARKSTLKIHTLCHSGTKSYKCDSCDKRFLWKSNLESHILCHSGRKPFQCDRCGKHFLRRSNLERHVLWHSGTDVSASQ